MALYKDLDFKSFSPYKHDEEVVVTKHMQVDSIGLYRETTERLAAQAMLPPAVILEQQAYVLARWAGSTFYDFYLRRRSNGDLR